MFSCQLAQGLLMDGAQGSKRTPAEQPEHRLVWGTHFDGAVEPWMGQVNSRVCRLVLTCWGSLRPLSSSLVTHITQQDMTASLTLKWWSFAQTHGTPWPAPPASQSCFQVENKVVCVTLEWAPLGSVQNPCLSESTAPRCRGRSGKPGKLSLPKQEAHRRARGGALLPLLLGFSLWASVSRG